MLEKIRSQEVEFDFNKQTDVRKVIMNVLHGLEKLRGDREGFWGEERSWFHIEGEISKSKLNKKRVFLQFFD